MLFNSYAFIFLFLPVVLLGYFVVGRRSDLAPVVWLALASLVFYAFGGWPFVPLLLASIAFNYGVGYLLIARKLSRRARLAVLTAGVTGDLVVLGIVKYAGFFTANLNALFSTGFIVNVALPVGISFYTFTQIAFLVDAYRGNVARYALPHYALFVTYFPHLIAGPILHHKDMIPQFERAETKRPDPHLILCGLIIFAIGLFKKTCLADGVQPLVSQAFGPDTPTFDQAWIGVLAYTFQLYFDFSGYSDMAIGMSLIRHFPAAEFRLALQGDVHRRFLAALAHDAVAIPARLSLYSARRQPPWPYPALHQSHGHHAARWSLARRGMDLCCVGRAAWRLSLHQSRLEPVRPCGPVTLRASGRHRGNGRDVSRRRRRLGLLPCP